MIGSETVVNAVVNIHTYNNISHGNLQLQAAGFGGLLHVENFNTISLGIQKLVSVDP